MTPSFLDVTSYDVFNGDADGICALQQLRLHSPRNAQLITGLKRDIELLKQVSPNKGDEITVLDISMEKNRPALDRAIAAGAKVFYADHHFCSEVPTHELLDCHIDMTADTCTSLIVNQLLDGAYANWAVVGAYGDNMDQRATDLGRTLGFDDQALLELQQLGVCLNYNGYGFSLEDLLLHPAELFEKVRPFKNPLEFVKQEPCYESLAAQHQEDMQQARLATPFKETPAGAIYMLPNEPWARRIVGVMGNNLAKQNPHKAHALLTETSDKSYQVSVRAPYIRKQGADLLCNQFETGGGRQAAAGINQLAEASLDHFIQRFFIQFEQNDQ